VSLLSIDPKWRKPASRTDSGDPLVIGLVNNMPDKALRSTERQVGELLTCAAGERAVSLRLFSLPELPRSAAGRFHVVEHHEPIEALWGSKLDGLIVTGTEPRAEALADEPYWPAFQKLVDWAEQHTASTIWSCLAAHAAVHHLDGIERQPLERKLFGVFDCARVTDHPLVEFGPARWLVPHSRHNELPEEALIERGYSILARSDKAGADTFIKEGNSLFVFLQGHPEYDAGALLREYRRDVMRFLRNEVVCYPDLPYEYFAEDSEEALDTFRQRAVRERDIGLMAKFPPAAVRATLTGPWREAAIGLYANWLTHLEEQRALGQDWSAASTSGLSVARSGTHG
jgi:homoserine O-succinyltransferase